MASENLGGDQVQLAIVIGSVMSRARTLFNHLQRKAHKRRV